MYVLSALLLVGFANPRFVLCHGHCLSDSGPEVEQLTGGEVAEAGRVQEIGDPETKIDPKPVRNFAKPLSLLQSETS